MVFIPVKLDEGFDFSLFLEDLSFELPRNLMLMRMRQQHPVVVRALRQALETEPQPWDGWRTAGTLVAFRPTQPTPWVEEELAAREAARAAADIEGEERLDPDPGIQGDSIADLDDAAAVVARLLSALERIEDLEKTAADLPAALEEARREAQASRDRAEQAEQKVNEAREQLERVRDEIAPAEDPAERRSCWSASPASRRPRPTTPASRPSCSRASSASSAVRGALATEQDELAGAHRRARGSGSPTPTRSRAAGAHRRARGSASPTTAAARDELLAPPPRQARGHPARAGREDREPPSAPAPRRWRPPRSASPPRWPPSTSAPQTDRERPRRPGRGARDERSRRPRPRSGTRAGQRGGHRRPRGAARRRRAGRRGRPRGARAAGREAAEAVREELRAEIERLRAEREQESARRHRRSRRSSSASSASASSTARPPARSSPPRSSASSRSAARPSACASRSTDVQVEKAEAEGLAGDDRRRLEELQRESAEAAGSGSTRCASWPTSCAPSRRRPRGVRARSAPSWPR